MSDAVTAVVCVMLVGVAICFAIACVASVREMLMFGTGAAPCVFGLAGAVLFAWFAWTLFGKIGVERKVIAAEELKARIYQLEIKLQGLSNSFDDAQVWCGEITHTIYEQGNRLERIERAEVNEAEWAHRVYTWIEAEYEWAKKVTDKVNGEVYPEPTDPDQCE